MHDQAQQLPPNAPPFPDASELADLLGVTTPTIYRWQADGTIPAPFKITSKVTRWDLAAVLLHIKERAIPRRDTRNANRASLASPSHPNNTRAEVKAPIVTRKTRKPITKRASKKSVTTDVTTNSS